MNFNNSSALWRSKGKYVLGVNKFIDPVIERGEGSYVWDVDGNRYLDFNCGQFCLCFGHTYLPYIECMSEQMEKIIHTNTNTMTSIVFNALERLVTINNNKLKAGILLSTGAEANEFAFRFSKSIKQANKMIYLNQGYHGLTLGAQSVSSFGHWSFPKVPGTFGITAPDTLSNESFLSVEMIKKILKENLNQIAAVVMEPVLGAGGMIYPPVSFFKEVRFLCDEFDVILIFDECQTGFGRTGDWFCYQKYDVNPDILVFAKAGGAGLPVSGVLFNEKLSDGVRKGNLTHFSSHQNDPLAAAALLFVINEIERKNVLERVKKYGEIILSRLSEISAGTDVIINPRGIGLMIAFDINENLFQHNLNPGMKLVELLLLKGILIQCINRGRTFRIMPNYLISQEEIDIFFTGLYEAINEIT